MVQETLWNGMVLQQPSDQFLLGTDSMVCAWFSRFPHRSRILDLGCGSGAIALMLLASDPSLHLTGIELQAECAAAAAENARRNQVDFQVIHGDLRQHRSLFSPGSMDGVVSNPPYFPVGSGQTAEGLLAKARSEETCSLDDLFQAAAWVLKYGGRLTLVHRPERLADLICGLRARQLEPKRIRFVRHSAASPVNLVLLEARKGGRPGLSYEPDLILRQPDGTETTEYRQVYHKL